MEVAADTITQFPGRHDAAVYAHLRDVRCHGGPQRQNGAANSQSIAYLVFDPGDYAGIVPPVQVEEVFNLGTFVLSHPAADHRRGYRFYFHYGVEYLCDWPVRWSLCRRVGVCFYCGSCQRDQRACSRSVYLILGDLAFLGV